MWAKEENRGDTGHGLRKDSRQSDKTRLKEETGGFSHIANLCLLVFSVLWPVTQKSISVRRVEKCLSNIAIPRLHLEDSRE